MPKQATVREHLSGFIDQLEILDSHEHLPMEKDRPPEADVLAEWLDVVPANKIIGFGGDYCFVDGVYGHQRMARDDVAAALAVKVDDGSFDLDRALQIARWLFVDNPSRILKLQDRLGSQPKAARERAGRRGPR